MADSPFKFCSDCGANRWTTVSDREFICVACGFRHFITPIPAAVAVIVDAQNRVMVIRRAHEPGLGKLGLPGGVIEPGETGEAAAARETREEVGLALSADAFSYIATLNNRYFFQGFHWPTIDLCYLAHVTEFGKLMADPAEVKECLLCPLDAVPLHEFAFESNAEAVRYLQRFATLSDRVPGGGAFAQREGGEHGEQETAVEA